MLPQSSAGNSAVRAFLSNAEKLKMSGSAAHCKAGFYLKKEKSQIDTSVQAGHASSSYAAEVYSSGAVERANESIKKNLIVRT